MPAPDLKLLGPLGALAGTWEGDEGLDVAFSNSQGVVAETKFRERVVMNPFGPVDNGDQHLYGLDYRMAAWRTGEEDPFHTEVGYWLWDPDAGQVMRCFMVPRGTVLIAGGPAKADSKSFTMQAELGSQTYGILENEYLHIAASTTLYQATITISGDSFSYEETSTLSLKKMDEPLAHTDRNTLHRVEG